MFPSLKLFLYLFIYFSIYAYIQAYDCMLPQCTNLIVNKWEFKMSLTYLNEVCDQYVNAFEESNFKR